MIKHTLMAVGLGLTLFLLYLFQYTGAFKSVTVAESRRGPFTFIYLDHVGPYHKIVEKIQIVEKWSLENGLKCRLSFGQYFDDPRAVEEGRLKSRGGCLVDPLVKAEFVTFESLKKLLPVDFKTDVFNETNALVALFDGAPSIGPMKVYPAAENFMRENKIKPLASVLEIYEVFNKNAMHTVYIWPLP